MSKGDTFENDLLKLIFNATAIANMADNARTSLSGAGKILYSGALSPTIVISNTGVAPIFSSSSTITED
jgi:hypothetical protein